jgi:hypothetical protein
MKADTELRALIEHCGGKFHSIFVGHTQQGVGALVIFTVNGNEFFLPLSDVTEDNIRRMVAATRGWRRWLYLIYKHLERE